MCRDTMVGIRDLSAYLDAYLKVGSVPDYSRAINGLQVDADTPVSLVVAAVDACEATIEMAVAAGASLLIVHHGLFWSGSAPIAGHLGRKIRRLIRNQLSLYSAHLPLDCHPEVGNNHLLAARLGVKNPAPFGEYEGMRIGVAGDVSGSIQDLAVCVQRELGVAPSVIAKGHPAAGRTAVVTGAGAGYLGEAAAAGVNTLVTGEGTHHAYLQAEEWGINLILAGHYATETVGVQALAAHVERQFGIPWRFLDHPTGM